MALRRDVQSPFLYQLSHDPLAASLFYHLAKQRDVKLLKYVLSRGTDLNVRDPNGKNALIMALKAYDHAAVEILLDIGADPTHNDEHNESALRVVCTHENLRPSLRSMFLQKFRQKCSNSEEAAQKLIDAGGHLYQAAHTKDAKILEYMLERGFPVDFTTNELTKSTALHVAVSLTDLDSAKVLLNHGADVHSADASGCNPLYYAYGYEDKDHSAEKVELLRLLLSRGASLTTSNSFFGIGRGFFQAATTLWYGDSRAVALVLSHWDFTAKEKYRDLDLMHYLALNHNSGLFDELKVHAHKLNVDAVTRDGSSPLRFAAKYGNSRMVEFLLDRGCDVDKAIGSNGRPALYGACTYALPEYEKEYDECVELLLEYGADPQWISDEDETIFDAKMSNNRNWYEKLEPLIARLAMMEELGTTISEVIRAKIKLRSEWEVCYDRCRGVLRTRVYGTVTVSKLLAASEGNWVRYAGNEDLLNELGRICDEQRTESYFSYYRKILTKRMSKGLELRKLRDEAAGSICRIFGGCIGKTHVVTSRISEYLNEQDLRQLCQL